MIFLPFFTGALLRFAMLPAMRLLTASFAPSTAGDRRGEEKPRRRAHRSDFGSRTKAFTREGKRYVQDPELWGGWLSVDESCVVDLEAHR